MPRTFHKYNFVFIFALHVGIYQFDKSLGIGAQITGINGTGDSDRIRIIYLFY